jgi:hypothetical protein
MAPLLFSLLLYAAHPDAYAQVGGQHAISDVQGRVEVKRAGWDKFVPATVNMQVANGDLFQLTKKASAKVTCADLNAVHIQKSGERLHCDTAKLDFKFKGNGTRPPRAGDLVTEVPILVSPRRTKILDLHPTLRWAPVPGAATYTVKIKRGSDDIWSQEVKGATELKYPAGAPALTPGTTYKVEIIAGGRSSDDEGAVNAGFSVLSQDDARAVRAVEERIRAGKHSAVVTAFLVANLYATWGVNPDDPRDERWALNAEAVELLEKETASQTDAPSLRTLGHIYLTLGLSTLAEERYRRALQLSEAADDVQGKALTHYAIARVFTVRFNRAEAKKWFLSARALFQSFGDADSVAKVDEELSKVEQ